MVTSAMSEAPELLDDEWDMPLEKERMNNTEESPIQTAKEREEIYERVKRDIVNELVNVRTALFENADSVVHTVQIARDPLSIAEQAGVVPDETDVLVAAFGFWKVLKSTIEQGEYDAQVLIAHIDFQTSEILNVTAGVVSKTAAA